MKTLSLSLVISSIVAATSPSTMATNLDVDWLYLSGFGSWVSRSEAINSEQTRVELPVSTLEANQFWWQSTNDQTQLVWQQPSSFSMPQKGSVVEITDEVGSWLVKEVASGHLVLQQDNELRYWPQSQWHRLHWQTSGNDHGFELTVLQPEDERSQLFYAWRDSKLTAEVRYRLSLESTDPVLYQELIVSNLTDNDFIAPGYSYSQSSRAPVLAMRSNMITEAASDMVAAPVSSESQGVPTLVSDQALMLQAGSHVWLPVSSTELSLAERRYEVEWDTRSQGTQQAQTTLHLKTTDELPDMQGPIALGVFDQQIPLLDSLYQPTDAKTANLNLGSSSLVSVTSELRTPNEWQLLFSNRSEEIIELQFTATHWNGRTRSDFPMDVKIPANSERALEAHLNENGEFRLIN